MLLLMNVTFLRLIKYLVRLNNHALRPNLLRGKFFCLFWTFNIVLVFWWADNLFLKALVSLTLKNWALFPEFLWKLPARVALYFWLRMVKFLAMFFLTTLILASLLALPDEAFAFLKFLNYSLSFSMLALIVWLSLSLIFWLTLFSTIITKFIILNYR